MLHWSLKLTDCDLYEIEQMFMLSNNPMKSWFLLSWSYRNRWVVEGWFTDTSKRNCSGFTFEFFGLADAIVRFVGTSAWNLTLMSA
jgi:hypothetical protein